MSKIILNLVAMGKNDVVYPANPFYKENQRSLEKQSAFLSLNKELVEDQLNNEDFAPQYKELKVLLRLIEQLENKEDGEIVHLSFKVTKVSDNYEVDENFEPDLELI